MNRLAEAWSETPVRRSVLTIGIVSATTWAIALAVVLSWRTELPDPVASHWGPGGVDGTFSLGPLLILVSVLHLGLVATFVAITVQGAAASAWHRRVLTGCATASGVLLPAVLVASLHGQRGLVDAYDAPVWGPPLWWAFGMAVAGLVLGVVVAGGETQAAQRPRDPRREQALATSPTERVAWSARAVSGVGLVAVATSAVAALVLLVAIGQWWALVLVLIIEMMALTMMSWRVTIDRRGVRVVSLLGWPRFIVGPAEVAGVEVLEIEPVADFGGWGIRFGRHRRTGVILRRGPALLVRRHGKRDLVVTVDDAPRGAATAAALFG